MWNAGGVSSTQYPGQQLPPQGWYPDPAGQAAERYWDGQSWTTATRSAPQTDWRSQPGGWVPDQRFAGMVSGPCTADGVPLAGWWSRVGAMIIDSLLISLVALIAAIPLWPQLSAGFTAWWNDAIRAAQVGGSMPDYTDPSYQIMGTYWILFAVTRVTHFLYSLGMQMWRGGTLGMLALRLRVSPVDRGVDHHGLAIGQAAIRNLAYQVMGVFWPVMLINVLLPLGNSKRQTLHDMAARTQVVKIG